MFSLIITIISVALVAALALATLYYGGDSFNKGRADAQAAQILNQGQQVLGAAELFYLKNGAWPADTQDLVDEGFLDAIPVVQAPQGSVSTAVAAAREWVMPTAGVPVFTLPNIETDICRAVNKKTYGMDGVLKQAYASLSAQCYGQTENAYTVVVSKGGERLASALPGPDVSPTPALPAPTETDPWAKQPGTQVGGGSTPPGGGTGGGSLPEGTDAAACLRTTNTTNLNPEVNGNFALYNGCSRPLVARAFDEHWSPDMFDVMGYSATVNGEGNVFLPTIEFGWVYTDEDPSGPSPLGISSGPLEFSLFANLYGGPYTVIDSGSVGENDAVRLYAFRHYGGVSEVRNQNTIQLEVKFADQDDSAYVPYSFVVTLVPGAGCSDPESDGDWVCVTP